MNANAIIKTVTSVTKKWAKQRKAEERNASAEARRRHQLTSSARVTIKDAVFACIAAAYDDVSDGGRLPAHARQLMYNTRRRIQDQTDGQLNDAYFTQTLLPQYMDQHARETEDWNVVFDARGNFVEPHTTKNVPLGTLEVRQYLSRRAADDEIDFDLGSLFPTHGPASRYSAVLFIEKEGFWPLFREVKLAERFDIAVMSTKGLSNTASRELVDRICGEHDIPLLILRDFDKAGFSIAGTLARNTQRFQFTNQIRTIDLGLRLEDVKEWELEAETFYTQSGSSSIRKNLRRNGATIQEIKFIAERRQRVELNAFTSRDMVRFVEAKLEQHGITKVVPEGQVLESAYRRALKTEYVRSRFDELKEEADEFADNAPVPRLKREVQRAIKRDPTLPWDIVVGNVAAKVFEDQNGGQSVARRVPSVQRPGNDK